MDKDIQLAKDLIKKIREIMSPKFDYIVQFAPQVRFHESCDELWLDSIVFEADGEYMDAIIIGEGGIMLNLEDGPYQHLYKCLDMKDILNCKPEDIAPLRPVCEQSVAKASELYRKRANR
jgi:uncharacterized protein YegJ (DUF2314 family)